MSNYYLCKKSQSLTQNVKHLGTLFWYLIYLLFSIIYFLLPIKSLPLLPYWILNSITYSSTWALPWVAMPVMFLIVPRSTVSIWSKSEFSAVQADPPHRTAFKADLWLDSEVAFTCNSLTNFRKYQEASAMTGNGKQVNLLKFALKKFVKLHQTNWSESILAGFG